MDNFMFEVIKDADSVCVRTKAGTPVFQEKMLINNVIPGIIPLDRINENGTDYLSYQVTGLKTVTSAVGKNKYNYFMISKLIKDLVRILLFSSEYLLDEDDFVIELDRMYLTLPDYGLKLLYLPGYGRNMIEQLSLLFEDMMNRLDYGEERAVDFIYKLYGKLKEDVSLSCFSSEIDTMISSYDEAMIEKQMKVDEETKLLDRMAFTSNIVENEKKAKEEKREIIERMDKEKKEDDGDDGDADESYFSWLKKKFNSSQKANEKNRRDNLKENKGSKNATFDTKENEQIKETVRKAETTPVIETVPERTVVVHTRRKEMLKLISVQGREDILVDSYPFFIGSMQKYANGVVQGGNVSRIHARFDKKKGIIYLTDLNSTNGTFVNGQELMPDNEVALCVGDVIAFADAEYEVVVKNDAGLK